MRTHYPVLVLGGGTAGLTVAAQLRGLPNPPEVGIVEPSTRHFYQPLWTLVGGGVFPREASLRDEADYIPPGADWIRAAVARIDPERNQVTLEDGATLEYQFLVVALGIHLDWDKIPGLSESVGRAGTGVCSNYRYETVDATWEILRSFRSGTALFTEPLTPVKCGGAPQKIMYLADDHLRRTGVRSACALHFYNAKGTIFSSPYYGERLTAITEQRDLHVHLNHDLRELRPASREAVFANLKDVSEEVVHYDMIHVTPPMSAPPVVRESPLAGPDGWVSVDRYSLRHTTFANVFSLGDCSNLPTSKTGAAVRKQAPVVVQNLMAAVDGRIGTARYDGYTSCPLVTGYGKLILAEFDYDKKPTETFPFDQSIERYSMYALKAYVLPQVYWNGMLRGRM